MSDFRINTGNAFADSILERRLANAPEYLALIDYLESKGILDREEFSKFLNQNFKYYVHAVKAARDSQED